jgi:hypothetical protein
MLNGALGAASKSSDLGAHDPSFATLMHKNYWARSCIRIRPASFITAPGA